MRVFFFFLICLSSLFSFEKVVIWGHKLHTHTHSYIHEGFYKAFQHLGYKTYWLDETDSIDFDFSNTLFLTEGQADTHIPLRSDCKYMLHNCTSPKYQKLLPSNYFTFQVYTKSIHSVPNLIKLDSCVYYDLPGRCIYMPWATDLFPEEIDAFKQNVLAPLNNQVIWVGTIGEGIFGNLEELEPFMNACEENNLDFIQRVSIAAEEHCKLISDSYLAPAIVGKWQAEAGYIPCRIFKNISYGKLGITNSEITYELFDRKIVYNRDTYQLFYDAKKRLETITQEEVNELMDLVKTKHTYIQRIQTLLSFLDLVNSYFR